MSPGPSPRNQFSFSKVKTFHQCPARYRYRYLKGLAEAFRSIESHLGSAVHDVLEWLYREREERRDPTAQATLDRFEQTWHLGLGDEIAVIRDGEEADDHLATGRHLLRAFVTSVFARDRSTTLALERRVSLQLGDGLVFSGFADRVGRTAKGRLFVVDYKTSRSLGDPSDFSEGLQAPLYAVCLQRDDDRDRSSLAGYHYLRHGTTSWHEVDSGACDRLVGRFRELAETVRGATEFPTRPGPLCAWCGFNHLCPDAQVPGHLAGGLRLATRRAAEALEPPRGE